MKNLQIQQEAIKNVKRQTMEEILDTENQLNCDLTGGFGAEKQNNRYTTTILVTNKQYIANTFN